MKGYYSRFFSPLLYLPIQTHIHIPDLSLYSTFLCIKSPLRGRTYIDTDGNDLCPVQDTPVAASKDEFVNFNQDVYLQVPLESIGSGMYLVILFFLAPHVPTYIHTYIVSNIYIYIL